MENKKILKVNNYSKTVNTIAIFGIILGIATVIFGIFVPVGYLFLWESAGFSANLVDKSIVVIATRLSLLITFFGGFEILFFALTLANNNNTTTITVEETENHSTNG